MLTYDWNGHVDIPVMYPEKSDKEVAGMVRMLMRGQLEHEAICCAARDRIMGLSKENAKLKAALSMTREGVDADEAKRLQNIQT